MQTTEVAKQQFEKIQQQKNALIASGKGTPEEKAVLDTRLLNIVFHGIDSTEKNPETEIDPSIYLVKKKCLQLVEIP